MLAHRRDFLRNLGYLAAAGTGAVAASKALASVAQPGGHDAQHANVPANPDGVLVDLSLCVGCRLCEHACKSANDIEPGPVESYDDQSVFATRRRPGSEALTVVNAWPTDKADEPVYAKLNCVHCNYSSCVSACIVGALRKQENGAVTYDAWKCIGCRYCMVACPLQLPAYEYESAIMPQVRKCQFCHHRTTHGQLPACVEACPRQAMTFGKRSELIALAHERIRKHPLKYETHVYGEHEVGGTSWLYLSPVPFRQAGFLTLGNEAPPELTEKIQHGVFKYWIAPSAWYATLASLYFFTGRRAKAHEAAERAKGHHHVHRQPAPIPHKLLTPGVLALLAIVLTGAGFWLYRMIVGLGASTNLDQQRPWGLWIAMDVGSGIALAAGGFVSAFFFHVLHRERYHLLARSALLTALLGYTFYVPGLLADLGKWWKLPITMYPGCWQGNSVLFEVGMCVMIYLNVQYMELTPIVAERLLGERWFARFPRVFRLTEITKKVLDRMMPALLCLGVCLSCFHQSSLGNLMVIAPYKLHHLWWSPLAPLHFLLSAIMVGLPMVIFTILFASRCLHREPEMEALTPLARKYVPWFIAVYLATKVGDMIWRGSYQYLDGSVECWLWTAEMLLVVLPLTLFFSKKVTASPRSLAFACLLVILGVVLNRLSVLVLAFHPPYVTKTYIPSLTEFMISGGLVAALLLTYRVAVTYLPILEPRPAHPKPAPAPAPRTRYDRGRALATVGAVCAILICLVLVPRARGANPTTTGWTPATQRSATRSTTVPTTRTTSLGPAVVILKELEQEYDPVPFDHHTHAAMAEMWGGCVTCHHRTPDRTTRPASTLPHEKQQDLASAVPACKSCHAPERNDVLIGMPNLKGAYHRQCLNCHKEWTHANACNICHQPKKDRSVVVASTPVAPTPPTPDDITGRMHPPIPEPDEKVYLAAVEPADGRNVLFRHKEHTQTYGIRCAHCHRKDNCAACHDPKAPESARPHLMTAGRTWRQSHDPCVTCHEGDRCNSCHFADGSTPPPAFTHASTGQSLDKDHAGLSCASCHHLYKSAADLTCGDAACHPNRPPSRPVAYPLDLPGPLTPPTLASRIPTTQPIVEIPPNPKTLLRKVRAFSGGAQ